MANPTVWRISLNDVADIIGDDVAKTLTDRELEQIADRFGASIEWSDVLADVARSIIAERD
jgi:hypothetical protein